MSLKTKGMSHNIYYVDSAPYCGVNQMASTTCTPFYKRDHIDKDACFQEVRCAVVRPVANRA